MRYLQLLSVLLLCVVWAAAQDSSQTSPTQTSPNQTTTTPTQTTNNSGGSETTVQGCLSGSGGSFTLTDKNGMSYQLTGDNAKLSEHVGHEIQVTGTTSSAAASPSGGEMGKTNSSPQSLQVSSMKHISKTCSK